jgi:tetratricopeptide (TPR) repeat protein
MSPHRYHQHLIEQFPMQSIQIRNGNQCSARTLRVAGRFGVSLLATVLLLASSTARAQRASVGTPLPGEAMGVEHALAEKNFDQAISLSRIALEKYPNDPRLWTLTGMAYVGAGESTFAVTSYRRALKLDHVFLPALEGLAQIEYQKNAPDAPELLRHVLELRPADPTTHAMLAALEYKSGDCKEAVTHFRAAESIIGSNFNALSEFGVCLSNAEFTDEAVSVLQQALTLDPQSQQAHYNLALALWRSKKGDEALGVLDPSLQAAPSESSSSGAEDAFVLAAEIYESKNDTPHAVELLRKAIALNPHHLQSYLSFATLCNDHAAYKVGIDMLNLGISQMPRAAQLYSARGVLYAQLGNSKQAMDDFEAADRMDPQLSAATVAEGVTLAQTHDYANAVATFRKEARRHPDNALNQYLLAETLSQHGVEPGSAEFAEQFRAAKKAVQLDPHVALAHNLLGSLYLRQGSPALAIEQFEAALKTDPANQEALYHLILAIRKTDRKNEIPALTKRLANSRAVAGEREAHTIRYKLIESAVSKSNTDVRPN